jgi:hypothetical protein
MTIRTALIIRNEVLTLALGKINQGSGAGLIKFYAGTIPTNPETAPAGSLLVTLTFSDPAFEAISNSLSTAATITNGTVVTNGTVGWFRITDSAGTALFDGTATVTGGGGDLTFNTIAWIAGGTVGITSLKMEFPL